jgi:hypothetical protein
VAPCYDFGLKFLCSSGSSTLRFFKSTMFNTSDGGKVFSSVA